MKTFLAKARAPVALITLAWALVAPSSARAQVAVAESLIVDLDAADASAGSATWVNRVADSPVGDFVEVGDPLLTDQLGAPAVSFNDLVTGDAYQSEDNAPDGLVGIDPTRSIEAWVVNFDLLGEETIVSWAKRGGPCGTNISFNYGTDANFGAVGHWCLDNQDIGWGDTVPVAGEWHHLAYTYDGTTTRVYADGMLFNEEVLGPGSINTWPGTKINLAAQLQGNGIDLDFGQEGSLLLGRLRIHDGVLTPEEILQNYNAEKDDFPIVGSAPSFLNAPVEDAVFAGGDPYSVRLTVDGFPLPEVSVTEPAGAALTREGPGTWRLSYSLPDPAPASFDVTVLATNAAGEEEAAWTVEVRTAPGPGDIEVAEELLVSLDASDPSAGTPEWANDGTLGEFVEVGDPFVEVIDGGNAVTFNSTAALDAYQCVDLAPAGITGPDATRSIEVWAFNPAINNEETLVSWAHRGGPCGSNMSFNYGTNAAFGAVGHWCNPDIGWGTVPLEGQWHHLVYTFDGTTTRVYADGELSNEEVLGPGQIDTHPDTPITIAAQIEGNGVDLNTGLRGVLSIGRVRVHDGVLTPFQVRNNFLAEKSDFEIPPAAPTFERIPVDPFLFAGEPTYSVGFKVDGWPLPVVELLEPAGGILLQDGPKEWSVSYDLPDPPPASFTVTLKATNDVAPGGVVATWTVEVRQPPGPGDPLQVAGELFVSLDAADETAGTPTWANQGTIGDFLEVGDPVVIDVEGAPAVEFNSTEIQDAYQSQVPAPDGLVGPDPTRTIEAWVMNPAAAGEETIVAWGHRGGPCGTNMSFSYGTDTRFGAIGHWCLDNQDIGWGTVPPIGAWHHLAYTYDGTTTRVYADGELANEEVLGPGSIDTHPDTLITLAAQLADDGITLDFNLRGTLAIGRLRIHDEVLRPAQIRHNYEIERPDFPLPPPPVPEGLDGPPVHRYSFAENADDSIGGANGTPLGAVTFENGMAVLGNDSLPNSNGIFQPPGAYVDLPNNLISELGDEVTIETWVTWNGPEGTAWQRIFDFGTSEGGEDSSSGAGTTGYLFLTPWSGTGTLRFGYRDPAFFEERQLDGASLTPGVPHHLVVSWNGTEGTVALYLDGALISRNVPHFSLTELVDDNVWLGRSQWPDVMFNGAYDELRIYDYALSANQVLGDFQAGPDCLNGLDPECSIGGGGGPQFERGDADASGALNITDGIFILNFLFLGGPDPSCKDAADADDSGALNITDGIYVLNFLFLGGPDPKAPYPDCGEDPDDPDDTLDCATAHPACGGA